MVTQDFERLLDACRRGEAGASGRLVALVYADLRRLAHAQMGHSPRERTLNTTALVHECYLRIVDPAAASIESRQHFFNLASRVMRQVLCDYARERLAQKRGGGEVHDSLSALDRELHTEATELIELDDLLRRLEAAEPRWARVFECRYFAGLSDQETADALGIGLRTAQREWQQARQYLAEQLGG